MSKEFHNWKKNVDESQILWLGLDCVSATTNTINSAVLDELNLILQEVAEDKSIQGLVIYSEKKSGFIAGADIHHFSKFKEPEQIQDFLRKGLAVFSRLEKLKIPTLALIDGFCMGGGLELALACRYRIVSSRAETKLGLPEVMLGFNPGWGGTVRLPKLIGGFQALTQMLLSGKTVASNAAKHLGLVDDVVPVRQLKTAARYYLLNKPEPKHPGLVAKLFNHGLARRLVAKFIRANLQKKVNMDHYPAPYAMVNLWEKFYGMGDKAYDMETESVLNLVFQHPTAENMIQAFLLKERLKGFAKQADFSVKRVHVVGAGIMGGDIAAWCALKGMQVSLQDDNLAMMAKTFARANLLFKKRLKQPHLVQQALDRLVMDQNGDGVAQADVIIEAVFENLEVKQKIFQNIEKKAKSTAILATNTSSIPLADIASVMKKPERLVGIHFFNPVAQMDLVEVVRSEHSTDDLIQKACAFVGQLGKLPLPVKSSPGFLVNRVLMPYLLESVQLLDEGIPAELIDKAARDFGMMMGPIELADTVGMDVCLAVANNLTQAFGGTVPSLLEEKVKLGDLGKKTGQGFYKYKQGKPVKAKITKHVVAQDIAQRLIMRMVNEASICLRESVVEDADLLDAGMLFGTGFAPFRRGPMHYAKQFGKEQLNELFCQLESQYGERFRMEV